MHHLVPEVLDKAGNPGLGSMAVVQHAAAGATKRPAHLEAQRAVKVLADMRLAPELERAVGGVNKRALLQRVPAQERVVAHQGRNVAPRHAQLQGTMCEGQCLVICAGQAPTTALAYVAA